MATGMILKRYGLKPVNKCSDARISSKNFLKRVRFLSDFTRIEMACYILSTGALPPQMNLF